MGVFNKTVKKRGFTVVEIIIVISVIAILAGIAFVAYPGYQQRTRDSTRKSDLTQIAAAISAYALKNDNYVGETSGCGLSGEGNGWFNADEDNSTVGPEYGESILDCLKNAGVIGAGQFEDPLGCKWSSGDKCGVPDGSPTHAYMKATCKKDGVPITYVLAHIEGEPRRNTEIDNLCDTGTLPGFPGATKNWGSRYAMNYYVTVK